MDGPENLKISLRNATDRVRSFLVADWGAVYVTTIAAILMAPLIWFVPYHEERFGNLYTLSFFFGQAIRSGTSYLWNPYYLGGFPSFADLIGGFTSPLNATLFYLLPALAAQQTIIIAGAIAGTLAAYAFGRTLGKSQVASVVLALTVLLSRTFDGLTVGIFSAYDFLYVPLACLCLAKIRASTGLQAAIPWAAALVFLFSSELIGGHPQMMIYSSIVVGLVALYLDFGSPHDVRPRRRFKVTLTLAASIAIAFVAALPQLIHTAAIVGESVRNGGFSTTVAVWTPPTSLVALLLPPNLQLPYLSGALLGAYVGGLPILLALFAILSAPRDREVRFWGGLAVVALLFALRVPVLAQIHDHLPILSRSSGTGRIAVYASFAIATLAAIGYDRLVARMTGWERASLRTLIAGGVAIGTVLVSLAASIAGFAALSASPDLRSRLLGTLLRLKNPSLSIEHYSAIFDKTVETLHRSFSPHDPTIYLLAAILFLSWLLLYLWRRGSLTKNTLAFATVVLITSNLVVVFGVEELGLLVPQSRLTTPSSTIATVLARRESSGDSRILPILWSEASFKDTAMPSTLASRVAMTRDFAIGEFPSIFGVASMSGIEAMRTARQDVMLNTVLDTGELETVDTDIAKSLPSEAPLSAASRPVTVERKTQYLADRIGLLSALNVGYVISPYPLPPPFEPIEVAPDPDLTVPLYLYANPGALPKTYLARGPVVWTGTERDLLLAMIDTADFTSKTFLECGDCAVSGPTGATSGTLDIIIDRPGRLEARVTVPDETWLVYDQTFLTGWTATVDDVIVPIARANYLFQAVRVPPGSHQVKFSYRNVLQTGKPSVK